MTADLGGRVELRPGCDMMIGRDRCPPSVQRAGLTFVAESREDDGRPDAGGSRTLTADEGGGDDDGLREALPTLPLQGSLKSAGCTQEVLLVAPQK